MRTFATGPRFLPRIFEVVAHSPSWKNTVLIVNFDQWGISRNTSRRATLWLRTTLTLTWSTVRRYLASVFRPSSLRCLRATPALGLSSATDVYDHTTVLKLIEWRWGAPTFDGQRCIPQIFNLATTMNFSSPNTDVSGVPVPGGVTAAPCFLGTIFGSVTAHARTTAGPNDWEGGDGSPWAGLAQKRNSQAVA